jgi:PhnB protein
MQTQVNAIPEGYHSLTPYIIVQDASKAIDFYKKAFGANEMLRMDGPNGKIMHCELQIGDSRIMLADETPSMGHGPEAGGETSFSLLLYVENVDEIFKRAVAAGAKELRGLKNEFYGDRMGTLLDPFGHKWNLATHIEDVSEEEMKKRAEKLPH